MLYEQRQRINKVQLDAARFPAFWEKRVRRHIEELNIDASIQEQEIVDF